jgi:hypothetical protein
MVRVLGASTFALIRLGPTAQAASRFPDPAIARPARRAKKASTELSDLRR